MIGGLETGYDSNNRREMYEGATNEWRRRKFGNKGRVVEEVSRMNALRFCGDYFADSFFDCLRYQ